MNRCIHWRLRAAAAIRALPVLACLWLAAQTTLGSPGAATTLTVFGHLKAADPSELSAPKVAPLAPNLPSVRYQWAIAQPPLAAETVTNLKALKASDTGGRFQIGLGRPFEQPLLLEAKSAPQADWTLLPDGWRIWSIDVASVGALGLRVHLSSLALPPGVRLVVYDPDNPSACSQPLTAQSLGGAKDYWVETILAQRVIVECQVPPGVDTSGLSLAVAGVSHLYQLPALPDSTLKAGTCENDASCFPAFSQEASAVARIGFISGGNAYLCTGFLLADGNADSASNFFMTANHCVPNQSVASTLEFWWLYQTKSCNGSPPSLSSVPHTAGGADLLGAGTQSDYSLAQLRQAPPSGASFLGWSTDSPSPGDALTCIHHPGGNPMAISFGRQVNTDGNFWNVQWSSGVTENGSSGSPLLNANHLVIGQLMGGASSCSNPSGVDSFGRFNVSYPNLQQFLSGGGSGSSNSVGFVKGTYYGLFADDTNGVSALSSGSVTLTTTTKGKFTGNFRAGAMHFSLRGGFDNTGNAGATVQSHSLGTMQVQLTLDPSDSDHISGIVNTPQWSADFDAFRDVFDGGKSVSYQAGRYTMVLPGVATATDQPNGNGYACINVTKAGRVSASGMLADGTKFSESATLSKEGMWPFYAPLYGNQGSLFSWVVFTNSPNSDLAGDLNWIKPAQANSKFFPAGFTNLVSVAGSAYVRPTAGTPVLDATDANVTFAGGGLSQNFVNAIALDINSRVFNQGSNSLQMSFSLSAGTFSGKVQDPSSGQRLPFRGVVLQKSNSGSGFFLGSGLSGHVSVQPTQ